MAKLREGGNADGSMEKARLRERQRRSITTKIFNGLRKHGNYCLAPRADINDVLRALAKEAGWVVEPDGTTYRSNPNATKAASRPLDLASSSLQQCPACMALGSYGRGKASSSSSHGGDCSTTASPRHVSLHQPSYSSGEGAALRPTFASCHPYPARWAPASSGRNPTRDWDAALALTSSGVAAGRLLGGAHLGSMVGYHAGDGGSHSVIPHQRFAFFQEARDSSHSASPPPLYPGAV